MRLWGYMRVVHYDTAPMIEISQEIKREENQRQEIVHKDLHDSERVDRVRKWLEETYHQIHCMEIEKKSDDKLCESPRDQVFLDFENFSSISEKGFKAEFSEPRIPEKPRKAMMDASYLYRCRGHLKVRDS